VDLGKTTSVLEPELDGSVDTSDNDYSKYAKPQPVRDCYTMIGWVGDRVMECAEGNDVEKLTIRKIVEDRYLSNINCENVVEVVQRDTLYVCQEDIMNVDCIRILTGYSPKSCHDRFVMREE
jgi:hypothetical protein